MAYFDTIFGGFLAGLGFVVAEHLFNKIYKKAKIFIHPIRNAGNPSA